MNLNQIIESGKAQASRTPSGDHPVPPDNVVLPRDYVVRHPAVRAMCTCEGHDLMTYVPVTRISLLLASSHDVTSGG
jgi:hypothetical protein